MKKIHVILMLVSLFSSATVLAGNQANTISLTLGGGYEYFSAKRHIDNVGLPFAALAYQLTDHWGIEGFAARFNTRSHQDQDNNKNVNGKLFAIDGVYHLAAYDKIEPYLLAGIGVSDINPNGNDAHDEGNVNAGIGLQFLIDKPLAFRFDVRDFFSTVGGKNDIMMDAGITLFFDLC